MKKLKNFDRLPFDVRIKILLKRVRKCRMKYVKHSLKGIWLAYKMVDYIGIPDNQEETDALKRALNCYDEQIKDMEDCFKYARDYVKEETNNANPTNQKEVV